MEKSCLVLLLLAVVIGMASAQNAVQLTKNSADDIHPDWSPDGSKIVFASNRSGNYDIYVMNSDGSGLKKLTNDPLDEVFPSWSNDGKRIVYVKGYFYGGDWFWQSDVNNGEIWIMNSDGSNKRKVTDGIASPVFSPSDNEIVFVGGNLLRIYKYNLNTHSKIIITPQFYLKTGGGIFRLSWHGNRIVYDAYPFGIQTFDSNGNNYKQVYKTDDGPVNPDWSPDGGKIAYSNNTWRNGYVNNIEIIDLATKKVTVLENTSSIDSWPSWSPDGKKIAFVSNRNGNNDIWIANLNSGSNERKTTSIKKVCNLSGSIAVDKHGNLYVARYKEGQVIKIDKDGEESVYATGIDKPRSPVLDNEGNLYVGSFDGNIYKIPPGGRKSIVASAIWSPQGMGFDSKGDLYVASGYDGNIYQIKGHTKKIVVSGFNFPKHLAVDANGDLYVVENKGNEITKVSSGVKTTFATFNEQINGIAIDKNRNLYVSHSGKISKVNSGELVTIIDNLNHPSYLAIDSNELFVNTQEGIIKITLSKNAKNCSCINVPLNANAWTQESHRQGVYESTSEGLLVKGGAWTNGKLTNGKIDGNYLLSKQSFDFTKGGDVYIAFIAHGGGYMGIYVPGITEVTDTIFIHTGNKTTDIKIPWLTTYSSWMGSVVIPDDETLFVHLNVKSNRVYRWSVCSDNYDDQGGKLIAQSNGIVSKEHWQYFKNAKIPIYFLDNYANERAYLIVKEVKVCVNGNGG